MQASERRDVVNYSRPGGGLKAYTPLQTLFLLRLQGLITKRQQHVAGPDAGDWRMRLLDKALYSTYRDCVELGLADEARGLLRRVRQPQSS